MFEAAQRAYHDAGVDPRTEIDSFICCLEDFLEGTSIFDEYVPDQLGAMQRPVQTVTADGLFGLATGAMLISSGIASVVAVEAHSKVSDVRTLGAIEAFALDPVLNRLLRFCARGRGARHERVPRAHPPVRGALRDGGSEEPRRQLDNPRAAYPAGVAVEDVDDSSPVAWPLRELEVASRADGCVVIVLASEERPRPHRGTRVAPRHAGRPAPSLESRTWGEAESVTRAAELAYRRAEISDPQEEIDLAEVDDTYAYRELQHLEALARERARARALLGDGELEPDGDLPVNVSGGSLGQGNLFEANGLVRVLEASSSSAARRGSGRWTRSTSRSLSPRARRRPLRRRSRSSPTTRGPGDEARGCRPRLVLGHRHGSRGRFYRDGLGLSVSSRHGDEWAELDAGSIRTGCTRAGRPDDAARRDRGVPGRRSRPREGLARGAGSWIRRAPRRGTGIARYASFDDPDGTRCS